MSLLRNENGSMHKTLKLIFVMTEFVIFVH